jgi:hypothetical protein
MVCKILSPLTESMLSSRSTPSEAQGKSTRQLHRTLLPNLILNLPALRQVRERCDGGGQQKTSAYFTNVA